MRFIFISLCLYFFSMPSYASQECRSLIKKADRINEHKVEVNGRVSERFAKVIVEVYYGRDFIGSKVVRSSSDGHYSALVYTKREASFRPDVKIICQ